MSYKYFGRLSGGSNAGSSLGATAPANTTTPFDPQSTATKFIAYGEAATALNVNRALSALSANSDYLASILDTPALRKDLLTPNRDNGVGGTSSGFVELNNLAMGTTEINLATDPSPPVWVYVGLHKDSLSDCINLFRVKDGQYLNDTYPDIGEMDKVSVTDIKAYPAANSFFNGQGSYVGTPEFAAPDVIPGITQAAPGMAPYNGSPLSVNIASWQEDGPVIGDSVTQYGWTDIFARPGCYVLVEGETSNTYNNGLYQIARISGVADGATGDKAVLTRGGLHRVTVSNGSHFDTGDRVSWRSIPQHNANSINTARENTSYVMYKILHDNNSPSGPADLYLSSFSGPEDFKLDGSPYKAMRTSDTSTAVHSVGSMGLSDQEANAQQNWTMPIGTQLYKHASGGPTADYAEVTAVIPAGYPITFATNSDPGNVKLCSPPGFLLNPVLVVSDIIGGDYYAHCSSLTTARERLITPGQSLNRFTYENPQDRQFFTESDANRLDAFTKFIRIGHETITSNMYPGPLSPTKQILGENLWKISIDDDGGAKDIIANGGLSVGDTLSFKHTWSVSQLSITTATLVAFGDESGTDYLILKDVDNSGWEHSVDPINTSYGVQKDPITGGGDLNNFASYLTLGGIDYYVDTVVQGPYLYDDNSTRYVPSFGLNAAYNNHYSASKTARGNRGLGNYILVRHGKPLTVKLPLFAGDSGFVASTTEGLRIEVADPSASQKLITMGSINAADRATIGHTSNSLTFDDHNTPNAIALSDSLNTALPEEIQHQSMLGSFEGLRLEDQDAPVFSTSVLKSAGFLTVNLDLVIGSHTFLYKGAVHKQTSQTQLTVPTNQTTYIYYDFTLSTYAMSITYDVEDINKAYIAKVVSNNSIITEAVNISKLVSRVDERLPIYVGVPGTNDYDKSKASFETLGEALAAIEVWSTASANSDRTYTIELISDTAEVESATQGITFPRRIPTHGITINGNGFTVNWGSSLSDKSLFDLNGKGNLTFDNIQFNYQGTTTQATDPVVNVFTSTSGSLSGLTNIVIHRCRTLGTTTGVIHSFFATLSNTVDVGSLTISDCFMDRLANTFITITGNAQKVFVRNCSAFLFTDGDTKNATNFRRAIQVGGGDASVSDQSFDVSEQIVVEQCSFIGSTSTNDFQGGIYLSAVGHVHIAENTFQHVEAEPVIEVQSNSTTLGSLTISNNITKDITSVTCVAIGASIDKARIVGNTLDGATNAIWLINCDSSHITNNSIVSGDIQCSLDSSNNIISGNRNVSPTTNTSGIRVHSSTHDTIANNSTYFITIPSSATNTHVISNTLYGDVFSGNVVLGSIYMIGGSGSKCAISGNIFSGDNASITAKIRMSNCPEAIVSGNNNFEEIEITGTSPDCSIESNVGYEGSPGLVISFVGGSVTNNRNCADIILTAVAHSTVVKGNSFLPATQCTISIFPGSRYAVVSDNTMGHDSENVNRLDIFVGDYGSNNLNTGSSPGATVSGNITRGGDIIVWGPRCSVSGNILSAQPGNTLASGDIYVGCTKWVNSTVNIDVTHTSVANNVLVEGTIYLGGGQNTLIGNILTEFDDTGNYKTTANSPQGAIVIDVKDRSTILTSNRPLLHSNVIMGNIYRSYAANTTNGFGPQVSGNEFWYGSGDPTNGHDLTYISIGSDIHRLNIEDPE